MRKKKFDLKLSSTFTALCFLLGILFSTASQAQIPAQCGSPGCTSNDVRITKAAITDVNGSFFSCSGTEDVTGAIYIYLLLPTQKG